MIYFREVTFSFPKFHSLVLFYLSSMYKYTLFTAVLLTQLFSGYDAGDQISTEHQVMEFPYCYPNDLTGTFSFNELSGKVFMLEMSASW